MSKITDVYQKGYAKIDPKTLDRALACPEIHHQQTL